MNENHEINKSPETIDANLAFDFSQQIDVRRIRQTLDKMKWYKEHGYTTFIFPEKVRQAIENGINPSDEELLEIVSQEYDQQKYESKQNDLEEGWQVEKDIFLKKLSSMGLPIQSEYKIFLTRYGGGGSFQTPDTVLVNLEFRKGDTLLTIFHEIIHLTIQSLIEEYKISHWTKECLVDLIFNNIFPARERRQNYPIKTAEIDKLFNQHFPDIKKIISEVSLLEEAQK